MGILRSISSVFGKGKSGKASPVEPFAAAPPAPVVSAPPPVEAPPAGPSPKAPPQKGPSPKSSGSRPASPPKPFKEQALSPPRAPLTPEQAKVSARKSPQPSAQPAVGSAASSPSVGFPSEAPLRSAAGGCTTPEVAEATAPPPRRPAASPPPPEAEGEDTLSFDVPLQQIHAGVGEAFGQMIATSLQSSKWDKRSQALKAVAATLKGLDIQGMAAPGSTGMLGKGLRLRDRTRCWRLSCQLLHYSLRDKVMPVRLASIELFTDTFSNTEGIVPKEEVHFALGVLIEHLIDRLGDSNLRLHESARRCVHFAAERPGLMGLGAVLATLRTRLEAKAVVKGGDRAKTFFGILDTVGVLLQHFPGRRRGVASRKDELDEDEEADAACASEDSWTQDDIAPFIIAGMDDSLGPRVRNSAAALAVSVYQTFGAEALKPVLAQLRPAKQALLQRKFEESEGTPGCGLEAGEEEEGGVAREDLGDLVVCGAGFKQPQHTSQLPGMLNEETEEEFLMDGILEEAGAVFTNGRGPGEVSGTPAFGGNGVAGAQASAFANSLRGPNDLDLEDEARLLELELMNLGLDLDLDGLDEQTALLASLQEAPAQVPQEQYVLQQASQGGMSRHGLSIEVF